ncbi:TonB-dependent receptor [Silanimonas sp.]|uniref:TonB-dependent receptor n=1 Tax=Silanimonas sp. TaxID=1929290 RepID=UPI0022C12A42|nr:TonB-dependent receptor [Silanimonas sp.]MCZ8165681.1 TonB-dependent receptor [Silanimonas sp.]
MLNLKRDMLSVALASAIMAMAANAQAQAAQADDEEEAKSEEAKQLDAVEVRSGIVAGIENAIDTKRDSSSIVEAVSAEDIGKLPDMSIADSLARLPGVTAQRVRGRATDINIRGLSGDFHTTTLNGREQVSMGVNRGVEFDQYPSELLKQVVVAKTPSASMVGQGLTGTIDLQTIRPLDFSERVIAFNVRADQNRLEDSKITGERGSLSYVDQNDARTLGLVLGYAYQNSPGQSNGWRAWGYDGTGLIGGSTIQSRITDSVREGFNAALEYRPNDAHRGSFDVYYSQFDVTTNQRGIEIGLGGGGYLTAPNPVRNGTTTTWTGATPVFRTDIYANEDDLLSFGWNHEWTIDEDWKLTADLSRSTAERDGRNFESNAGFAPGTSTTLTTTLNPGGWYDMTYGLDFNDPSILRLRDIGGWGGDGFDKPYSTEDKLSQARFELERSFESGVISSLEFGLNYTTREKERFATEDRLCINSCSLSNQSAPYPTGGSFGFGFFGIPFLPTFNPNSVNYDRLNRDADFGGARKSFGVEEDLTTLYIQANLSGDLGSVPFRGNVGVQAIRADQTGFGRITYNGNNLGSPFSVNETYTEVLPSLNLIFELPSEQILRTALARQAARPRMDDLSAGFGYGVNQTAPGGARWEASGGNPTLRPWIANAFDISYEKYFGGKAYVSAAFFFKDLKNYIARQPVADDFTGLPIPDGVTQLPASNIGIYTRPVNAEGGLMAGWEFAVSVPFDMIWAPLEGFGAQASYTDTRTSIDPSLLGLSEIPGLSRYTSNLTLYWERFGWGVRATRRTRSAYVGEGINVFLEPVFPTIGSEEIVDLQISYTVQEGPLKNLGILFQIANLTDEPFTTNLGGPELPGQYEDYGNNALLGISYKF